MAAETLPEIIPEVFRALSRGIHTAIPGKIVKYNRTAYRAEVLPLIKHVTLKNKEIEVKPITDVPVLLTGGGSGIIDIELVKGDNVLLIFCESDIGGWKSSNGEKQIAPNDLSSHERNNAIAIPCIIPDGKISDFKDIPRIKIDKDKTMTLDNNSGNIVIKPTGQVSINDHFTVDV